VVARGVERVRDISKRCLMMEHCGCGRASTKERTTCAPKAVPIARWPGQTPRIGTNAPQRRITSTVTPASSVFRRARKDTCRRIQRILPQ
jgi:hypothetical protein